MNLSKMYCVHMATFIDNIQLVLINLCFFGIVIWFITEYFLPIMFVFFISGFYRKAIGPIRRKYGKADTCRTISLVGRAHPVVVAPSLQSSLGSSGVRSLAVTFSSVVAWGWRHSSGFGRGKRGLCRHRPCRRCDRFRLYGRPRNFVSKCRR